MNERIKELAEQSGLKVESWMTNPPKPFQILGSVEEFEKFAELLILEVLSDADEMMRLSNAYLDQGIDIELDLTKEIKNNFGINDEQET